MACFTAIFRPPTDEPFFSSMARLASSSTALKYASINTKPDKVKSQIQMYVKEKILIFT